MTTDIAEAENEASVGEVRRFRSALGLGIEDMVIHYHPELEYLVNKGLHVRPATEAEAAVYAARAEDPAWADLYAPGEPPRVILPRTVQEMVALLEQADAEPEPEPEPEAPALDDRGEEALAAFNLAHDELAAEEAAAEVHHDTKVLHVPQEDQ